MRFLAGLVVGLVLPVVALAVVLWLGLYDVSATRPPTALERFLGGTLAERSVERRAPKGKSPLAQTQEAVRAGLEHYREDCLVCHGAPGLPPGEVAKGLNPPAPDLSKADTQEASDGELFQVVSQGIRMTGMPGWTPTHSEREIWEMVAFVRHLPSLAEEEKQALRQEKHEEPGEKKEEGTAHGAEHGQPTGATAPALGRQGKVRSQDGAARR